MPQGLDVYFLVFAIVLAIDAIGNMVLWRFTKNNMFLKAGVAWIANFFNFSCHGIARNYDEFTLLAHALFYITIVSLVAVLLDATRQKYPLKKFVILGFAGTIISLLVFEFSRSYTLAAAILDIMIFIPPAYYGARTLKLPNLDIAVKVLAIDLICIGLHFLDYPFLYNHPIFSIYGFSLAFIFSIGTSIIMPILIFRHSANINRFELERLLDEKTKELIERNKLLEVANEKLSRSV